MSYEAAREKIQKCSAPVGDPLAQNHELLAALNELTVALETDLVQIKKALSHVALLLESREEE
ncbi:MAG: hypothetical protein ACR2QQ_05690 [Gammaproteobacteria bacterium]